MSVSSPQDSALLAAQVELFLLRASIPPPAPSKDGLVAIAPESVPVTGEEAAMILARMPKPIRCTARTTEGVLGVECVQLTGAREGRMQAIFSAVMEERLLSSGAQPHAAAPGNRVLLLSGGQPEEELSVPDHAFRRWYQDYQQPPSAGFAVEAQDAKAAGPVFRVYRYEPGDPEDLPEAIRSLLR